ncbi:hypothetical protein KUCAC02_027383 [Chaenocephalus aceratus]|uniref:Uncharacterized protein n=1 Tax=Chaenocephalus aceratus TaxID=36190 RepID=A0ACB9W3D4_CHAAC|nr:hypothetical protein KUCAC02_027383 [Chaenocephalus aceratus]
MEEGEHLLQGNESVDSVSARASCSPACIMAPLVNLPKAGGHDTHPIMGVFFPPQCHVKRCCTFDLRQHRGRKMRAPRATSCGLLSFKVKE